MTEKIPEHLGRMISLHLDELSSKIFLAQLAAQPHLNTLYNEQQKQKCLDDVRANLNFLASSLKVAQVKIYTNYMGWLAKLMKHIHIEPEVMEAHFLLTEKILVEFFGQESKSILSHYIRRGLETYLKKEATEEMSESWIGNDQSKVLLSHLLKYEKNFALSYVMEQAKGGVPLKEIYLETLQPTLYQIGELWQQKKISVAQEHYCTAVIQHVISMLYPFLFRDRKINGKKMTAVCAYGELHEIGIRMVADFFEMDGWDTHYLGASVPMEGVLSHLKEIRPDLLAISATIATNLDFVDHLINKIQDDESEFNPVILLGGRAFGQDEELAARIGGHGFARNAQEAVVMGNRLIEESSYE